MTIEHLLAHRSGIGDYLDEDLIGDAGDYVMTRPVRELTDVSAFLPMLDGHEQRFEPGTRFVYDNGGYMVLALVAERANGRSYHELIDEQVVRPARLNSTMFLRSDELPGDAAIGYLYETGLRSNVFHLPVLGNGGIYTTLDDVDAFWSALFGGRIVSAETVAEMIRPRSDDESGTRRYGLGFWLRLERTVFLEGAGAGWPVRVGAGCCAGAVARSSSGDRARSRRCDMFVWVLEAKATDPGEVGRQLGRWTNEFGDTPGYLGATGGVTDDSRFLLFVRWESEEAGNELLMRPAHLAWYDEFQRSFDGAVEFAETADVTTHLAGGSDAAGFVQAMKVSGVDRQRVEAADREFETMAPHVRPDLIGGIRSWTSPDGFVAANYFTSEDDARAGERKDSPPELAERFEDFMAMMKDAEYFDFTEPFVHSAPGS